MSSPVATENAVETQFPMVLSLLIHRLLKTKLNYYFLVLPCTVPILFLTAFVLSNISTAMCRLPHST